MTTHKRAAPKRPFKPKPGRVYRTAELARWTANPTRLAKRLVQAGELKLLAQGLYAAPRRTHFGEAPPKPEAIMEAFLEGAPHVFTGPEYWNALGLGATALFPAYLVYNTRRTGEFVFGGYHFILRRVKFPRKPTPEWYAVDLIRHRNMVGLGRETLVQRLRLVLDQGKLEPQRLRKMALEFGTKETQQLVDEAITSSAGAQH